MTLEINFNENIINHINKFSTDLNNEQKKAYFLVYNHQQRNYPTSMNKPSQLLLYLSAPTGVTASNISGHTIHSACRFGFGENHKHTNTLSNKLLHQLQEFWSKIEYIIIDEISMIGQTLFAQFHAFLKKIKATDNHIPFTGMNILFASDFIQLPPVLDPALYMPNKITHISSSPDSQSLKYTKQKHSIRPSSINSKSVTNAAGRSLWLDVKHMIFLKKPMCQIEDLLFANILENIRNKDLTESHRSLIQSRILKDNQIIIPEWKDATFLVTRNDIRVQLNFDATREHACHFNQLLIYSCAIDFYNRTILNRKIRLKFLSTPDINENALCGILPLSIGMKVILTVNICTNDNLANRTQGILQQIIYDMNTIDLHSSSLHEKIIVLKNPPKYVVIELTYMICESYKNLHSNHVPVYPIKCSCIISAKDELSKKLLLI
ncbi:14739_t:CDS:2 [Cetraspora pellucida]|uniref:ATP-dependent DNA helicase n=1 Tax=Cetraspora pellucida TaxID=1433469 RepID=A0A9N9B1Y4_9GLOM|nr:14739_t:CDS:2 [Cetraspora pellucida]